MAIEDPYAREFDDFALDLKIRGYLSLGLRNPLTIARAGMHTTDTRRLWSWEKWERFSTTLRALTVARLRDA